MTERPSHTSPTPLDGCRLSLDEQPVEALWMRTADRRPAKPLRRRIGFTMAIDPRDAFESRTQCRATVSGHDARLLFDLRSQSENTSGWRMAKGYPAVIAAQGSPIIRDSLRRGKDIEEEDVRARDREPRRWYRRCCPPFGIRGRRPGELQDGWLRPALVGSARPQPADPYPVGREVRSGRGGPAALPAARRSPC